MCMHFFTNVYAFFWKSNGAGFGFWFLVFYAATQLAVQLPQRHIQVVRSSKVARKRLTDSNGTPTGMFSSYEREVFTSTIYFISWGYIIFVRTDFFFAHWTQRTRA